MPKRRNEPRIAKRSSAYKQKPKPKKGQQLKDEHSIAELNNDTNIHELVRESRQQITHIDTTKPEDPNHNVLKSLEDLARESITHKKKATSQRALNPNDLANLLSGINSINVSKESSTLGSAKDHNSMNNPRAAKVPVTMSVTENVTQTKPQLDDIEV